MEEKAYWVASRRIPGMGTKRFLSLLRHFGRGEGFWKAGRVELSKVQGLPPSWIDGFIAARAQIDLEQEMEQLHRSLVEAVTLEDPRYPANLKHIFDPPPVLFVKGKLMFEDSRAVAVVGSRRATQYGRAIAEEIAAGLAGAGVCVVSGLARGIDSAAHRGAVKAKGRTIGVLGCGVDIVYPRENRSLYRTIEEEGALVSEFPLGTPPVPRNFPARNRIISGLSRGVIVVEAAVNGGALITADFALEQGRDVFAVPGPYSSKYSVGTNRLIEEGARPVKEALDILLEYGWVKEVLPEEAPPEPRLDSTQEEPGLGADQIESRIIGMLSLEPVTIESIREKSGISPAVLSAQLMLMEIKGLVIKLPGGKYILKRGSV